MADKMIRVAGRFENDDGTISQPRGVRVDEDGYLLTRTQSTESSTVLTRLDNQLVYPSKTVDTRKASTLEVTIVTESIDTIRGFTARVLDSTGKASSNLPFIDYNAILRTDDITKKGTYYADVSGCEEVLLMSVSSSYNGVINIVTTDGICPTPIDAPVKYKRISSVDNLVEGKFRAIEPITDITLHSDTKLLQEYRDSTNDSSLSQFEDGDERLAGQTLFGPFGQVRLVSGSAWLVLL